MNTAGHSKQYLNLFLVFALLFWGNYMQAQTTTPPIYPNCERQATDLQDCFMESVKRDFEAAFQFPKNIEKVNFSVVFSASKEGTFEVLYIKTKQEAIKEEVIRVFNTLPHFTPASFNKHAVDKQFILPFNTVVPAPIPIEDESPSFVKKKLVKPPKKNGIYSSNLAIPLSYQTYNRFSSYYFAKNRHSSVKPFTYNQVSQTVNLDSLDAHLKKDKTSWLGRKFWNENMLAIQGDNYWFHLDPVADLQLGKDNADQDYTYNNTRAVKIEGGLGKMLSFSSTIAESQGRFAEYINLYARSLKPVNQAYAVVPSRDVSKYFETDAFDYPLATGTINFSPANFMDIQFGNDKNFIGDGYRSLFLSDVGAPYTFVKINTRFWNIQYTNLWTWLRDVDTPMGIDDPYKKKYMALHYLSWNATKSLNFGLFESVTWAKTEDRGFDAQYLNPVVIYRALEYANGSKGGNAMLGLSAKYNYKQTAQIYSQFVLDELTMKEFVKGDGYWANKYGIQVGAKYFNAFKLPNLTLQAEYNSVRPYTYSHHRPSLNYAHANQPLAHLWGSNFEEFTFIADYRKERWFATAKLVAGTKGFDYNTDADSFSYGGDILRFYSDRNDDYGIETGQGNKASILIGELQAGYLLNPATNLKLFGSLLYRDFNAPVPNDVFKNKTTTWFNIGFRTDINNWYIDF